MCAVNMSNSIEVFNQAEQLLSKSCDDQAFEIYWKLRKSDQVGSLAYYRMGQIANRRGDAVNSLRYHRRAFEMNPGLMQNITPADHQFHNYKYSFSKQTDITTCPLCGNTGREHSCYNVATYAHFTAGFDPIRLWMYCENCHHIFAANRPEDLGSILRESAHDSYLVPQANLFPYLATIISDLKKNASGNRFLEVGVGAGEMIAVAKEMQFDVTGIDIRPMYADAVSRMLDIPVHAVDFADFESDEKFDVICMGDVIEHTIDPIAILDKAVSLLNKGGVLWISTPNYESAYSMVMKHNDPMWMVCEHLNYFCFRSLKRILEQLGMEVVDYAVSGHYNGCMEVTSAKK